MGMIETLGQSRIVGCYNTRQARLLPEASSESIILDAVRGAVSDAGMQISDVDGIIADIMELGIFSSYFIPSLGHRPCWFGAYTSGIASVLQASAAIAAGLCNVVVVAAGQAGTHRSREGTAPWTRPDHQFTSPFGLYTAVEFALVAKRHMHVYGTTKAQLAEVAKTIRNNGAANPAAVYAGKGPFTASDILDSPLICDPFNLLDCSMTSEGGAAIVIARSDLAGDLPVKPIHLLGAGTDATGQGYTRPAIWDEAINLGARAAKRAFDACGLKPGDVDVAEFYDPFSFEIIRQFEAFGFCKPGEGGDFIMAGRISPDGEIPIVTDGGTLSFSHAGSAQMLQRIISGVHQLQGRCGPRQVADCNVALVSNGGSGALFSDVLLLGRESPA